ncbi:MAG: NAD(P)/FAD-dependent oxidoreductase [Pseudomonadota bacterium]|nr:NAD(P)/FAD-dependent oxidoreductase [Pseudomonadota bacterium]
MTDVQQAAPVKHYDVAIIGSGFSGLGMAIQLKKAGRNDFILLEKADGIGGTWRDNHYPGAACDVPSHMYSFSFEQNPNWSRFYSTQPEILAYMQGCAQKYDLMPHVQVNSELVEARWDNQKQHWKLQLTSGQRLTARVVVSGIGGLSRPALPKVKGLEKFKGEVFHSAEWNHDYDLTGKRVAVVGTGASAIQFVPQIAPKVGKLVLFQRTAPWLVPKPDMQMPNWTKATFSKLPASQKVFRSSVYWQAEAFAIGFINPKLMYGIEKLAKFHIKNQVKDPVLREKLTPNYTIGCKRVLFSNNYYPALCRDNVDVISAGVKEVTAHQVIDANGVAHDVDAIICGTGFDVQDPLGPLKIYDTQGVEVHERPEMNAYLGTTLKDLPNLFMLLGPNTALGHNSVVFMIESQIHYVMQCLAEMDKRKAQAIQVKPDAVDRYNQKIQSELKKTVWSQGGCKSWYFNDEGVNITLWPSFTWKYWLKMRSPVFSKFEFSKLQA